MAKSKVAVCSRGHSEWGTRTDGTRKCMACMRDHSRTTKANRRAHGLLKLPRIGGHSILYLPWAPLEALFANLEHAPGWYVNERQVVRWRKAGRLPLESADVICTEIFGIHPHSVYGDLFYHTEEETDGELRGHGSSDVG